MGCVSGTLFRDESHSWTAVSVELCWCSKGLIKDHPEEGDGDRSVRPPRPSPPRSLPGAPGGVTARAGPALAPRAPGEDGGGRGGRGAEAGAAGGAAAPHEGEAAPERGQEARRLTLRQISSAPGSLELGGEGGREAGRDGRGSAPRSVLPLTRPARTTAWGT